MKLLLSVGSVFIGLLESVRRVLQPAVDRLFGPINAGNENQQIYRGFEFEADEVLNRRKTQRARGRRWRGTRLAGLRTGG